MSVQYKDYYKILGVGRDATAEDIKKAFRKLAAKYHPDRHAGDKKMEEKFKEVNEAHEVLRDPEKRRAYDGLGTRFHQGQRIDPEDLGDLFGQVFGGRPGPGAGTPFTGPGGATFTFHTHGAPGDRGGFSDFFETLFGGGAGGFFRGGGQGAGGPEPEDFFDPFSNVRGGSGPGPGGFRAETRRRPPPGADPATANVETELTISLEEAMRGTTRKVAFQRSGPGAQPSLQHYDVKIPPGIREGQKIRLRGQGPTIGGRTGDIMITVRIAPDPRYDLKNGDLTMELPLAPWEAALGARLTVPAPTGPIQVTVPPGIESGKRLRLKGRGWPKEGAARGDLFLRISIRIPRQLSDQERDLFERLAKVSRFNPRQ